MNKSFRFLWTGRIISQLGDKFYLIALAWWILEKTDSPTTMGLFMTLSLLPGILVGLISGTFVDRWNRKLILILADLIRGILVLIVSWLSMTGTLEIWHVLAAAAAISIASSFFDPCVQAFIPQLVTEEELPKANSLNQMVGGLSAIAGPALGALAVSVFGFTWVFFVNALSYFLSGLLEGFITPPSNKIIDSNLPKVALIREIKEGLRFISSQKTMLLIFLVIGIAHFFVGSLMVTLPFLAQGLRGNGVQNLGYLQMMMGVGMLLGSVIGIKQKAAIQENRLFVLIMMFGVCFFIISGAQFLGFANVAVYMAIMTVFGLVIAVVSIFWQSLLQIKTPNNMAGRIFSISNIVGNTSLPIAYSVFGVILERSPIGNTMLFCGIGLIASSILMVAINNKK
ncbi:MAG TPA: MFS transporter [Syntrophomonadaceae bacterium]|nr:MFS transporter [Syntrophomonadaceae bacterium]